MSEVLLGNDLLTRLGINIRKQLDDIPKCTLDYKSGERVSGYPSYGGENIEDIKAVLDKALEMGQVNGLTDISKWKQLL
jgi:hypothetical protein